MGCRFCVCYLRKIHENTSVLNPVLWKGLTSRVLKGHSSYVFCINYNTEGTQLVSGGCDGDVKIWNAAKGASSLDLCLLDPLTLRRAMHQNVERPSRLRDRRAFQQ